MTQSFTQMAKLTLLLSTFVALTARAEALIRPDGPILDELKFTTEHTTAGDVARVHIVAHDQGFLTTTPSRLVAVSFDFAGLLNMDSLEVTQHFEATPTRQADGSYIAEIKINPFQATGEYGISRACLTAKNGGQTFYSAGRGQPDGTLGTYGNMSAGHAGEDSEVEVAHVTIDNPTHSDATSPIIQSYWLDQDVVSSAGTLVVKVNATNTPSGFLLGRPADCIISTDHGGGDEQDHRIPGTWSMESTGTLTGTFTLPQLSPGRYLLEDLYLVNRVGNYTWIGYFQYPGQSGIMVESQILPFGGQTLDQHPEVLRFEVR